MKYFIAGGASELGNRVVQGLTGKIDLQNITCLVRVTSDVSYLNTLGVNIKTGDITKPDTYMGILDAWTLYIDMTHPKYYHKSIVTVKEAGVKRAFFNTTTGIFSKYNEAADIYKVGESKIKSSGIEYTILRPSLIYRTDRDRNMTRLLKVLNKFPFFPVFGDGKCLMQPVYVQDLADGIVNAILSPEKTSGKEYNLCGPEAMAYIELLEIACWALGRKVRFIHIPHGIAVALAGFGEKLPGFPITREQVLRLLEDKKFDISLAVSELNYSPRNFSEGIKMEVSYLKSKGIL